MKLKIIFRRFRNAVRNPKRILIRLLIFTSPLFRDDLYLRLLFPLRTGYKLNLTSPRTFNEKLQWLKINYRKPMLTQMVDKYEAKFITEKKVGSNHVVNSFGVWDSFEQISFDELPDQFVLKTTHDQGGVVICTDKRTFNYDNARTILNRHLNRNSYYLTREWPYRNVKPRIMAEEFLENSTRGDLWDYKFLCFHGVPKIMYISMGRQGSHVPFYFFDMDFNLLDITTPHHEPGNLKIGKPHNWERMIQLAGQLSENLPHVRIDFYEINNRILLGEYTFFTFGGMSAPYDPPSLDLQMGEWIDLSKIV